jgi:2-(3-amino-3-carboxypropyl)histidine synthase
MVSYDLEAEKVVDFIKRTRARKVGVQLPPGLRTHWPEILSLLEKHGAEGVLVGSSCHGACDLADREALLAGCEALIHYGHSDMGLPSEIPVLYVEARMEINPCHAVEEILPTIGLRKIGLTTSVQHLSYLEELRLLLSSHDLEVYVGKPFGRARYPGQILGCDVGSASSVADRVEGFLHVGMGTFHPLGIAASTGKKVIAVNPLGGKVEISGEDFLRWRKGIIAKAASCREFGILLSTKKGQWRPELAKKIEEMLEKEGRRGRELVQDEIKVEELEDFGFEAYVCTACPRIALDDSKHVRVPILTPFEVEVMLEGREFQPYSIW